MFGRLIGKEIARSLVEGERRQGMSDYQLAIEREKRRQDQEKNGMNISRRCLGFIRGMFGGGGNHAMYLFGVAWRLDPR